MSQYPREWFSDSDDGTPIKPKDITDLGWSLISAEKSPYTGKMGVYTYTMNKEVGFNTGSNYHLTFYSDGSKPPLTIKEETYGSYDTPSYEMRFYVETKFALEVLMKLIGIIEL